MITQIEINGFKAFQNFSMVLRPFQVFIGPNGVGKTNLFDAIHLLSLLAGDHTVESAFEEGRGNIDELFTYYPDGTHAKLMMFGVEMLIERTISDASGKTRPVPSTRLRYELDLEYRAAEGREHVYVAREELYTIADANDKWVKDQIPTKSRKAWILREKRPPYIATVEDKGQLTIFRNQDSPGGGREALSVGELDRTAVSTANALRYPTIHAVRTEMQNWRFLQLNPVSLRARSNAANAVTLQPDGSNLPSVLLRMSRDNKDALTAVLRDTSKIIPDLHNLMLKQKPETGDALLEVETQDGSRFSSRVLSDGTLRLLALVTLKNDPHHRGVLCFEEPENGVQPQRLKQMVDVLYALSTNFNEVAPGQAADSPLPSGPLRQVLVNTHSPGLLASVPSDSLFFVGMKAQPSASGEASQNKGRSTRVIPVRPVLISDDQEQFYTWEQVKQYLDTDPLTRKREEYGL